LIKDGAFLTYANFEHFNGGRRAVSQAGRLKDLPTSLRLERRGGRVFASASQDGTNWTSFPPLEVSLPDEVKIGVLAVNTSSKIFGAELAEFRVFTRKDIDGR
jgi:regulation of enolase protein 1 (concanavalin A-like superfamily)